MLFNNSRNEIHRFKSQLLSCVRDSKLTIVCCQSHAPWREEFNACVRPVLDIGVKYLPDTKVTDHQGRGLQRGYAKASHEPSLSSRDKISPRSQLLWGLTPCSCDTGWPYNNGHHYNKYLVYTKPSTNTSPLQTGQTFVQDSRILFNL